MLTHTVYTNLEVVHPLTLKRPASSSLKKLLGNLLPFTLATLTPLPQLQFQFGGQASLQARPGFGHLGLRKERERRQGIKQEHNVRGRIASLKTFLKPSIYFADKTPPRKGGGGGVAPGSKWHLLSSSLPSSLFV